MKYELEATDDNIMNTLKNDALGRNKNIISLLKLLYLMKDNYNLCINGEWGTGKTFFVKQAIKSIELINKENANNNEETESEYEKKLKIKFSNIHTKNELFPIYYNAWEEDGNTDPLLTILYTIIENTGINLKNKEQKIKNTLLNVIKGIELKFGYSNQITGQEFDIGIEYNPKDEKVNIFEEINNKKNLKVNIENIIKEILKEKGFNRLIIFVDELDRCKPTFSVELLERIKGYLDNPKIMFIFSIDIYQLQYTIKKVYGEGFNGIYYLEKFFDMQMNLPTISLEKYVLYKKTLTKGWILDKISVEEFENLKFNLRDCNRYFQLIDLIRNYAENQGPFDEDDTHVLVDCIIIPILVMIKIKQANIYYKIVNGLGKEEFIYELRKNSLAMYEIESYFMTADERKNKKQEDILAQIYESLFIKRKENYIKIEKKENNRFEIEKKQKDKMNEILTFMNEYLNFDDDKE